MLALAALVTAGCGGGGDKAAPATTTTTVVAVTTTAVPSTTEPSTTVPSTIRAAPATTTTAGQTAASAVIEPERVAGIGLGATKSQATDVLGPPTMSGQNTDVGGATYDYLRWQLNGNRGLTLNFRNTALTLTDWAATTAGPATKAGVQVGDGAAKAVAAHGALQTFCCNSQVASVSQGGGRMIVVVDNDTQKVTQIIGGDPAYWSRSIAD